MRCSFRNAVRPVLLAFALAAIPLSVLADASPAALPTQTLPLRYARPWDVLKMLQWDGAPVANPRFPLPLGVRKITAAPEGNALRVEGTPEGVAKVRDIVQAIDINPRLVRVQVQFVRANVRDVDASGLASNVLVVLNGDPPGVVTTPVVTTASGPPVSALLQKLTEAQPADVSSATLVTCNNVAVSATLSLLFPRLSGTADGSGRYAVGTEADVTVIPRVNSDDTVTLALTPRVSVDDPAVPRTPSARTLRTVRSGETMVLTGLGKDAQTEMLLFVTPTLLPRQP